MFNSKGHLILLAEDGDKLYSALVTLDREIIKAAIIDKETPELYGAVVKAKITKLVPSMGGAFVEFRDFSERPQVGFLKHMFNKSTSASEKAKYSELNATVYAEVDREAQLGKPFRLRPYLGDDQVVHKAYSRLEEWAAECPNIPLLGNVEAIHWVPIDLRERFKIADKREVSEFLEDIKRLAESDCELVDGWSAIIVPTPSLVAIDLNHISGGNFDGNLKALKAICHEVVKRDLSGTIFVDPAGISSPKRSALGKVFSEELKSNYNPNYPLYKGVTPGGMIELYRSHKRRSVMQVKI